MGQIKKIEIICLPCHKCEILKERVQAILQCLELYYGIRIRYEFIHSENKKEIIKLAAKHGCTIVDLPILLINDQIAFIGHVKGENVIRMKLEEILKYH